VVAVQGRERGVAIGIVERQRLGHVVDRGRELTPREACRPQRVMSLDQKARIAAGPGEHQQARAELVGPVDLAARPVELEEAPHGRYQVGVSPMRWQSSCARL
jgi:hypothetical protein